MLPQRIDMFIEEHSTKPLSEYKKDNPHFIMEFLRDVSWNEKFELIHDFIENPKVEQAARAIDSEIANFIETEICQRVIENISEDDYFRHKAICEIYEKAQKEAITSKKAK